MINEINHQPLIYDLDLCEIEKVFDDWGEAKYRARQVWQGLYQNLWGKPEDFSPLPTQIRSKLGDAFSFSNLTPISYLESKDGETRKTLFQLS